MDPHSLHDHLIVFNTEGYVPVATTDAGADNFSSIGPFVITIDKFSEMFLFNRKRQTLFQRFLQWCQALAAADVRIMCVWFTGSFVENTSDPCDIDVILFFDRQQSEQETLLLNRTHVFETYGVDFESFDLRDNPVNSIHNLARKIILFSRVSGQKNQPEFGKRAMVSLLANDIEAGIMQQRM